MFFRQYDKRHLRQLPRNALEEYILSEDGATLKLDNHSVSSDENDHRWVTPPTQCPHWALLCS